MVVASGTRCVGPELFLYRIQADWLPRLLFPVGEMQKRDVWKEAETLGLPVEELKESQEICFVSQGDYRTFLEQERPELKQPGALWVSMVKCWGDGDRLYTPGQRRGLGIAVGQRLYVQKVVPGQANQCCARKNSSCSPIVRSGISVCSIGASVDRPSMWMSKSGMPLRRPPRRCCHQPTGPCRFSFISRNER